jgi:hypothetical protein
MRGARALRRDAAQRELAESGGGKSAAAEGGGGEKGGAGLRGMTVADAETGELFVLGNKTAFEEMDAEEVEQTAGAMGGGTLHARQTAAKRAERGMDPVSFAPAALVGLAPEKAAELQIYRARLDAEVVAAVEREEAREEARKKLLRDEPAEWKRKKLAEAFKKERAQARRELEQLRYDNELSLAHRLASLGVLK